MKPETEFRAEVTNDAELWLTQKNLFYYKIIQQSSLKNKVSHLLTYLTLVSNVFEKHHRI